MIRNTADSQADADRFVRRVTEADTVWLLQSRNGPAVSWSNERGEDEERVTVILFFSDSAYARRAQRKSFPGHVVASIRLFDFMHRWLPGMSKDGRLAGPNWTADLIGSEVEPYDLRRAIEECMTEEHLERHKAEFVRLTSAPRGA